MTSAIALRTCVTCGGGMSGFRPQARFCSAVCRARSHYHSDLETSRQKSRDRHRQQRAIRLQMPKPTSVCVVCHLEFEHRHKVRRYCSNRCGAKASYENRKDTAEYKASRLGYDQRRRARKSTGVVEVFESAEIFVRDRYRCHLCKKKCRADVVVPHPLAPTLDHLIPLADGGEHTRANTATACFLCNSVKGDRGGGEQLALV